jgi:hypothetical protein
MYRASCRWREQLTDGRVSARTVATQLTLRGASGGAARRMEKAPRKLRRAHVAVSPAVAAPGGRSGHGCSAVGDHSLIDTTASPSEHQPL